MPAKYLLALGKVEHILAQAVVTSVRHLRSAYYYNCILQNKDPLPCLQLEDGSNIVVKFGNEMSALDEGGDKVKAARPMFKTRVARAIADKRRPVAAILDQPAGRGKGRGRGRGEGRVRGRARGRGKIRRFGWTGYGNERQRCRGPGLK